jgi:hypothetical protein
MKKNQTIAISLATLLISIFLINACSKKTEPGPDAALSKNETGNQNLATSRLTSCSCGEYFSNTHSGLGFYLYSDTPLDFSCADSGATVTVGCTYYDVPNRFTVYDNNSLVVTTNWIGWAHCSGPWGFSITTAQAETFINFTYVPANAPYKLRVETTVIGCTGSCSSDPGCRDTDDNWQAHVTCN